MASDGGADTPPVMGVNHHEHVPQLSVLPPPADGPLQELSAPPTSPFLQMQHVQAALQLQQQQLAPEQEMMQPYTGEDMHTKVAGGSSYGRPLPYIKSEYVGDEEEDDHMALDVGTMIGPIVPTLPTSPPSIDHRIGAPAIGYGEGDDDRGAFEQHRVSFQTEAGDERMDGGME